MKSKIKELILGAVGRSGVDVIARSAHRRRLLVLCYHAVVSDDFPIDPRVNHAVSRSQFELQIREISRRWKPISATDLSLAIFEKQALPLSPVLITFDDGFRNNFEYAAPLLEKYHVPAIFFVTTGQIGTNRLLWTHEIVERVFAWPTRSLPQCAPLPTEVPSNPTDRLSFAARVVAKCKRLSNQERTDYLESLRQYELTIDAAWKREIYDFMSWDDVRELSVRGFDIGSHTVDHPILTSLPLADVDRQFAESKRRIECEIGRVCDCIAYPNGGDLDVSDQVVEVAKNAGFRLGFTLCGSLNPTTPRALTLDRLCVTRDISSRRLVLRASGLL